MTEAAQARRFWVALARAFGGAIFFSAPLLMTMEMWWLGHEMSRLRLASLLVLMVPLLIALDHYAGFKNQATTWGEDVIDGMIAYGVGIVSSIIVLCLFNVLNFETPVREWVGKVALQAVPASFGAVLATSQLGGEHVKSRRDAKEARSEHTGYRGELLFMLTGALFLAFNIAPTEEVMVIALQMTPWHAIALALASLGMMHAFVYAVEFHGTPQRPAATPVWSLFLRFTVPGYTIALLVSGYVLWAFGRFDGASMVTVIEESMVLGFPAALGAAAARLVI
jgi:putative integral membrane protein (TIGR02587 family)